MASGKVIFTGPYGPGLSLTSRTFNNLSTVTFDCARGVVSFTPLTQDIPLQEIKLDYSGITTFTATISGGVTTITLS